MAARRELSWHSEEGEEEEARLMRVKAGLKIRLGLALQLIIYIHKT